MTHRATAATDQVPDPKPDHEAILAAVGETAYCWDLPSDQLFWDANAPAVLGIPAEEIGTGRRFARFVAADSPANRFDAILSGEARDAGSGVAYELQYAIRLPNEPLRWVEDTGRWYAGADGRPARALGVVRLATARHEAEERLAYLSRYDRLSGAANRDHFSELLEQAISDATRLRASCCLLIVGLDRLDLINEGYGFGVADAVIAAVAKRLRSRLRGADVLGRFSGSKFAVLLNECSLDEMPVAAERLAAAIREDVVETVAGPIVAAVTIGGVAAPRHAGDAAEAVMRAHEALHEARARRPGSVGVYRPSPEREARRRENARASREIMAALEDDRIALAFEPVVDTGSRQPIFYECLLRLLREDGTELSAAGVIPAAERLGFVGRLDDRVLELGVAELVAAPTLHLSLNISPASTADAGWWSALARLLRTHPGVAERLIIEITETAEIRDMDEARGFVSRVKDLGCRIAIDDFGAGFTSFRHLRRLGVDIVKIDGSFVQNLTRSDEDRIFVRALLGLARDLGLSTVAEWVPSEEVAEMLRGWGCDYLQGEWIGKASLDRPWQPAPPAPGTPGTG